MGFRAAQPVLPKMLLVASLSQADAEELVDYVAGADAGLLHVSNLSSGAQALQKICQVAADIPWGEWLRDIGRGGIKEIAKADCDFVVFPATNTSLAILQDDEVGKILQVEASLNESLLRAVDELPVDAVLIGGEQEREYLLTWHHLMIFHRFAHLQTKPLLVCIPSNVTANELQVLWKVGVDGVVIEVEVGQPAGRLKELRQTIDKLAFPSQRKRRKAKALLPHISGEVDIVTEDEEE